MAEPSSGERSGQPRAHHGDVAPVVARRLLLFVTRVVFLIDNHHSQVREGSEYRRACSQHHFGFAAANSPPFLVALVFGQGAVQKRHLRAEPGQELRLHGGGEGNFRHQHQSRAADFEAAGNQPEINFRLPAARYPMEEHGLELSGLQLLREVVEHRALRGRQDKG